MRLIQLRCRCDGYGQREYVGKVELRYLTSFLIKHFLHDGLAHLLSNVLQHFVDASVAVLIIGVALVGAECNEQHGKLKIELSMLICSKTVLV
jgi:hypothetical protein